MNMIFTEFTYFQRDVSEMYTSLHSTELHLILHYGVSILLVLIFAVSNVCAECILGVSNQ